LHRARFGDLAPRRGGRPPVRGSLGTDQGRALAPPRRPGASPRGLDRAAGSLNRCRVGSAPRPPRHALRIRTDRSGMSSGAPRPRVLWVDHVHRILGGAEVNLLELLAEPESRVAWESVVACDPAGRLHERLEALGIERRPYSLASSLGGLRLVGSRFPLTGAIRSLRALRDARRRIGALVHDLRPAVVVSCTNKDHFAAWPACRAAGVPSVWWVNDILSRDFFPWAARRAFHAQARRGASRLIVVSEFARRALV